LFQHRCRSGHRAEEIVRFVGGGSHCQTKEKAQSVSI
jgi:hypothetical protein